MVNNENATMKPGIFTLLRKYRFAIGFALTITALYFTNRPVGTEAFDISVSNTIEMLSLLPPGKVMPEETREVLYRKAELELP